MGMIDVTRHILHLSLSTPQILWSQEGYSTLAPLEKDRTEVLLDRGGFLLRGSIYHFSQGCLGRRINMNSPAYTDNLPSILPRRRKEVEFINATDKCVGFVVLPTSWSLSKISEIALKVSAACVGELEAAVTRKIDEGITELALSPQVFSLPAHTASGQPVERELYPYRSCFFSESIDGQTVRVALFTRETERRQSSPFWPFSSESETHTVTIWTFWDVPIGTRYAVLPPQFYPGVIPVMAAYPCQKDDSIDRTVLRALVRKQMGTAGNARVAGLRT